MNGVAAEEGSAKSGPDIGLVVCARAIERHIEDARKCVSLRVCDRDNDQKHNGDENQEGESYRVFLQLHRHTW